MEYQHKISYWFPSGFEVYDDDGWYKQWDFKTPDDYTIAKSYFSMGYYTGLYSPFYANISFYWKGKFKVVGANMVFWHNSISCGYNIIGTVFHNCKYKKEGMYPPNSGYDGRYVDFSEEEKIPIAYVYTNNSSLPRSYWGAAESFVVNIYYNDLW
ncbi:hypothetical protein [Cysteiniphilum litorale]|uniref:hypothetical protein n=1 Tax=Cysteiniphilum litorale TaxID=2056700 RepID=UPI003F88111E